MPVFGLGVSAVHVLRLIDEQNRPCLEVHVPRDKLEESVELFLRLYPGKRLSIDGTIVQLGGSAPTTAPAASPSGPVAGTGVDVRGAEPMLDSVATLARLSSLMFAEHLECQRRLTDEMMQQYRKVRASLEEVDLMSRGARVVEFQEYLRGLQAMNASPLPASGEERRSWRNEQFERFLIGGLKATKIVKDA